MNYIDPVEVEGFQGGQMPRWQFVALCLAAAVVLAVVFAEITGTTDAGIELLGGVIFEARQ